MPMEQGAARHRQSASRVASAAIRPQSIRHRPLHFAHTVAAGLAERGSRAQGSRWSRKGLTTWRPSMIRPFWRSSVNRTSAPALSAVSTIRESRYDRCDTRLRRTTARTNTGWRASNWSSQRASTADGSSAHRFRQDACCPESDPTHEGDDESRREDRRSRSPGSDRGIPGRIRRDGVPEWAREPPA